MSQTEPETELKTEPKTEPKPDTEMQSETEPKPAPKSAAVRGRGQPEHWAEVTPDHPAVVDGDRSMTYKEWNDRANRLADWLVSLDSERKRACVRTHQSFEWFVINLALNKARWEHVAVNWRLTPHEVLGIVEDVDPEVLFFDDEEAGPLLDAAAERVPILVSLRTPDSRAQDLEELIASREPVGRLSTPRATLTTYSSGTTGTPKGARKQVAQDEEHQRRINEFSEVSRLKRSRPRGRTLLTLPLHHGVGPKSARTCHKVGGTVYLLDRYDPEAALEIIQKRRITHWKTVPTMLQRMRALPPEVLASYDVGSVKAVSTGSAPTPWAVKEWVMEYFGPVLHEGYGASEVGMVAVMRPDGHLERPGSCGLLRPHVEVRVIAPDGSELPRGETGELYIRTPVTISSYLGDHEEGDDRITPDGFFRSGDVGRLTEDNYLYITGRVKDMIIAGGANIYPAEVENALTGHPAVAEAAVIGIPEETFGEQVMAFCILRSGFSATEAELLEFIAPTLAPFKRPRRIEFVEDLPRNGMSKVLKTELRAPFWAGKDGFK